MTIFKGINPRAATSNTMLVAVVAFLVIAGNISFHSEVLKTY